MKIRKIDDRFINALLNGELSFFLERVKEDRKSLCLEIRDASVNIYYKGGSLLKITQGRGGYKLEFNAQYCNNKGNDEGFALLSGLNKYDIEGYKKSFYLIKEEMDSWFLKHPKAERDYQHKLLISNSEIIDIEYQIGHIMRLDMIMFANGKIYLVENKLGNGAIGGKAGIAKHYEDISKVISDTEIREEIIESVCNISRCKKALGLIDKEIKKDDIISVENLFLLADYNKRSKALSNEIAKMNGVVPSNLLMISSDNVKIDLTKIKSIFDYEG